MRKKKVKSCRNRESLKQLLESQEVTREGGMVFTRLMQIQVGCKHQAWGHSAKDSAH